MDLDFVPLAMKSCILKQRQRGRKGTLPASDQVTPNTSAGETSNNNSGKRRDGW